jgi:hypothetical protein
VRAAAAACVGYTALTIVLTWPVARGIAHDVPGDFGDPLFTSWVLAWDATHLGRGWWNANIFAPHPLTLAYSEHFLPQALAAMPVYWATRNPILCYNLLFLSTFVLSGLGMFLFARELTRSSGAAFVAGLAYAFAPYRFASLAHLQVLSSAWMPFVLFGLRRHFETRRTAPLAGAGVAWVVQNLSCGYYLLFFAPVALLYLAWEVSVRALWRDRGELLRLGATCAAVAAVTLPFLLPYAELRRLGFNPRSLAETRRFSADTYAYFTADASLHVWGSIMRAWPRAEGALFPGLTVSFLALAGIAERFRRPSARNARTLALYVLAAVFACIAGALLLGYPIRLPGIKITSLSRVLIAGAATSAILLAISQNVRAAIAARMRAPAAWLAVVAIFAVVMSFGPDIHARGRTVAGASLYTVFYDYVPGYDGLRVPARYAMIAALAMAALAGIGIAAFESRRGRAAWIAASVLIVVEAFAVPISVNQNSIDYTDASLAPLPPTVGTGSTTPPVYAYVAQLPTSIVLMELPLGEPAFDIRYTFYSTTHWRRLVNGYSGAAPKEYGRLTDATKDADTRPQRAWDALIGSGATHILVHEALYKNHRGARLSAWLQTNGAREIAAFGSDRLFAVR